MKIFKSDLPPKTNIQNLLEIPHLEKVLLWFLQNDDKMQIINSKSIHELFKLGVRPICEEHNNPDVLAKKVNDPKVANILERWLVSKIWLDLIRIMGIAQEKAKHNQGNMPMSVVFSEYLDEIEKQTVETLQNVIKISDKYKLKDNLNFDIETELDKIVTDKEKVDFKYNYLTDALISSEVRMLAWIYKDLFNEEYKIKK